VKSQKRGFPDESLEGFGADYVELRRQTGELVALILKSALPGAAGD